MGKRVAIFGFMRFSVVLSSATVHGWKATKGHSLAQNAASILAPKRIESRLRLAQAMPIASLARQTDADFVIYMLISGLLDEGSKRVIAQMAAKHAFVRVVEVDPSDNFQDIAARLTPADQPIITFRLDDDDAVGPNFIADLRGMAAPENEERVLSSPNGVYMAREGKHLTFQRVRYPHNAFGIAFYSRKGSTVMHQGNHARIPEAEMRLLPRPDAWIRSIHADSDSDTRLRSGPPKWTATPEAAGTHLPDYRDMDFKAAVRDLAPFRFKHRVGPFVKRWRGRVVRRTIGRLTRQATR